MKEKELKVNIPKGYEIDKENSTFECIKFKPVKINLTYREVAEKLNRDICFFINRGEIESYGQYASYDNPGVANNYNQIEKLLAINQLFNIAKFYNGDWRPDWNCLKETGYNIVKIKDCYNVYDCDSINIGMPAFENKEDAQAVIDNPNFRNILDIIFK